MRPLAHWNGSEADLDRLRRVTRDNCQCGEGKPTCPAHAMLTDQRVLDGLDFVRRERDRYQRGEFGLDVRDG